MARSRSGPTLYLMPGRLADVLALIQVLAYGDFAKRTHAGIEKQLRRVPLTAVSWTELGRQHPELFRVLEAEEHHSQQETVALIARFLQPNVESAVPDAAPKSPPLDAEVTSKLVELAIQLHDREVQRREWWKSIVVPILVALITATATLIGVHLGGAPKSPDPKGAASIQKAWQGFATDRRTGTLEAWSYWRENRVDCLKDMQFDIVNSIHAQWYREPSGCFYVGSENRYVLQFVNWLFNAGSIECIASARDADRDPKYIVVPRGAARETKAWRCG